MFGYTIDVCFYGYTLSAIEMLAIVVVLVTGGITFANTHQEHQARDKHTPDLE